MAACDQKVPSEKVNFCSNTIFSLLSKQSKKFHSAKPLAFTTRNNIRSKKSNNSKNQKEIDACEQKVTSEKANFCSNTVFSFYFQNRAKKISRRKTTRLFAPLPVSA